MFWICGVNIWFMIPYVCGDSIELVINFNIKFMNLLKLFDGGLDKGTGMCKATHPWGLHHHGGGVC